MESRTFYYDHLTKTQKQVYLHMSQKLLDESCELPYIIPSKFANANELINIYAALFLDTCSSRLPPMNIINACTRSNKSILSFRDGYNWTSPSQIELSKLEQLTKTFQLTAPTSPYDFATSIERYLCQNTTYYLRRDGIGESPYNALIQHQSYCTGLARTVRLLSNYQFLCVRGYLKKEFSLIESEPNAIGTPHIWNAFFYNGKPIFFDVCSNLRVANRTPIADELRNNFYRNNYANAPFCNTNFYSYDLLQKKYVLEKKELWLSEK